MKWRVHYEEQQRDGTWSAGSIDFSDLFTAQHRAGILEEEDGYRAVRVVEVVEES